MKREPAVERNTRVFRAYPTTFKMCKKASGHEAVLKVIGVGGGWAGYDMGGGRGREGVNMGK